MQLTALFTMPLRATKMLAMKLMAIMLVVCLQVSAGASSQTVTYSAKNARLETVFNAIRQQTGYVFFYKANVLKDAKPVNLDVKNAPIERVLQLCLDNQGLGYTIEDKTIVIAPKEAVKAPATNAGAAVAAEPQVPPTIDVKGRVVNEKGEPVIASVQIKGTKRGVSTNDQGYFELKGVDENAVLVVSGVNIETIEVKVNGRSELSNVVVKNKIVQGEEVVVVNTGYQQMKPNEVTGSVVVITKEQLDQRIAPDIISKLEGITNGLVFNKDATTGTNQLRIRGESTIFGYTEPLIVVDNFPYDGNISEINPNDVESVTILKDAAAASIWGVRAGNGVIVITTKRGRQGQSPKIEFNSNLTIGEKPDLFYAPYINPSDFIDLEILLFQRGKYNADLSDPNMKVVSPVVEILNRRKLGQISASDSATFIDRLRKNDWRNEFLNHVYRPEVTQQHQVNLSGGSNTIGYYFSAGIDKNLSNLIGKENSRITINSMNTYRPVKGLEFQLGFGYTQIRDINNQTRDIPNLYPYMQLVDASGNELSVPQRRARFEDTISNRGFQSWKYYPLQERSLNDYRSETHTVRMQTGLKYIILSGLEMGASYQYYRVQGKSENLTGLGSYAIRNSMNTFAVLDNGIYNGSNYPAGANLYIDNNSITGHNLRIKVEINKTFGQHKISGIVGMDVRDVRSRSNTSRLIGFNPDNGSYATPNLYTIYPTYPTGNSNLGGGVVQGLSYAGTLNRFRSYFADAAYTYADRYTFFGSARLDASNYFGVNTNNRTVPLWSAGGKWNISKERFFKSELISELGLRASYGYNGNISPNIAAVTTIAYSGFITAGYTGLGYAMVQDIPNPELRWEKSRQINLGMFFTLHKNVLSGTIEYYRKKGVDLIGDALFDPTTGINQLRGNFSNMITGGVDVQLMSTNINKGFKWNTTLIFNYSAEKVTRFDFGQLLGTYFNAHKFVTPVVGYPLRSVFSYKWGGLDPQTGNPQIILGDTLNRNYTSTTLNGRKLDDLVYSGRFNPPIAGSIFNNFSWKGISLSVNVTYKLGHYFRRQSVFYNSLVNGWQSGHSDFAQRWQQSGDENRTQVPSFIYPETSNGIRDAFYNYSDLLIEKADHIRLQFVNLQYRFPASLFKRIKIKGLDVYFYANNLGILWRANDKGIDPDFPYLNYPPSRTYTLGLKLTL